MEILVVTAELSPYTAGGPAGDCAFALSRALCQLGHGVTVAMPRVTGFEAAGVMVARRLTQLTLSSGEMVTVYDGQLPSGVRLVLFESSKLALRDAVVGEGGTEYPDVYARLATLCQAAGAFARQRESQGKPFDVMHLHGWQTAPAALYTKLPSVLTFYDPAEIGAVSEEELAEFRVESGLRARSRVADGYSLLALGMFSASAVTTTSPHLAERAVNVDFAGAFGAELAAREIDIVGIPAGLDYSLYNPATDAAVPSRYDAEASHLKGSCKAVVCRELELDPDAELPLLVFAGELSHDTGADLVAAAVLPLCKAPIQLIVAGTGDAKLRQKFSGTRISRLVNYRFLDRWSPELQRRLLAAADIALCPNRVAALGLSIRAAQRYGAVPVALATPVALDAIVDCPPDGSNGSGFLFDEASSDALRSAAERAIALSRSAGFIPLRRRIMGLDLGWERAARRYAQLFKSSSANSHPLDTHTS